MKTDKTFPVGLAIVSALAYFFLLGYFRPVNSHLLWFTLSSAIFGGAIIGLMWALFKEKKAPQPSHPQSASGLPWQLNQVFLFNTLHNIAALTVVDPEKARTTIEELAELIRTITYMEKEPTSLLAQEVRCAERLLAIERARLGDRLRVVKSIPPDCLEELLPSLTLLPIVERTIRQGVDLSDQPVQVSLSAQRHGGMLAIEVVELSPLNPGKLGKADPEFNRLEKVLKSHYGDRYSLKTMMLPEGGRKTRLELPRRTV